jgi:dUTP pyrophosphatase
MATVKYTGTGILPPQKEGDVGYDLVTASYTWIGPGRSGMVWTDVCLEIPESMFALVLPRSSSNLNQQISIPAAVIDSGYRGKIGAVVQNLSDSFFIVEKGQRLAQLVFFPVVTPELASVSELAPSERGASGFGSSGK